MTGALLLFTLSHPQKTAQPLYFRGTPIWPDDHLPLDHRVFLVKGRHLHVYPEGWLPEEAAINDGKYLVVNLRPSGTVLYLRKGKVLILDRGVLLDQKTSARWDAQTGKVKQGEEKNLESISIEWLMWDEVKKSIEKDEKERKQQFEEENQIGAQFLSPQG